jgi:hypothetical protein
MSCVNEEVTSPQANGAAASKSTTHEDRRKLTGHLREASVCTAESSRPESSEIGRYSLPQRSRSGSALVKPRREIRLLPLQQTAIKELEEDEIALVSIDPDESESSSSLHDIPVFAERFSSDSALNRTGRDLMSLPTANAVLVENNEDANEGSLRTMDLEADGIDSKEDESERSLSIEDILDIRCGSRTESQRLVQQSAITVTPQASETGSSSLSSACLYEQEDFSISLNENISKDKTTGLLGDQTKLSARCNDSLVLLHAGAAESREKNLRGWRSLKETRNDLYDESMLRFRAQGVGGGALSAQIKGIMGELSDLTLDLSGCSFTES